MEYGLIRLRINDSEYEKIQDEIYKCMEETNATISMEIIGKMCGWTRQIYYECEKLSVASGSLIYMLNQNGYKMDEDYEICFMLDEWGD